jgi:hypothetical protein
VRRTVWLALICLISLGALFTLRSNIGARPVHGEAASVLASSPDLSVGNRPPLAKSDRLPSAYFDKPVAKPEETVQVSPAVPEPAITPKANQPGDLSSQPTADTSEVTSWHWHVGSKITKRTTVAPR